MITTRIDPIPLRELKKYLAINFLDNTKMDGISQFIITEALLHNATDVHIDHIENQGYLFFRINNVLEEIACFNSQTTALIIDKFKYSASFRSHSLTEPWIGTIKHPKINKISFKLNIIPFTPVDSLIIRLIPQISAPPSLTNKPGIEKKIFIWQMGKVGSATMFASLLPHTKEYEWNSKKHVAQINYRIHNNILHTHSIQPIFDLLHKSSEEFVIISQIRDLLTRNISSVFQSMCENTPGNINFIAEEQEFKDFSFKKQKEEIIKKIQILNLGTELISWYQDLLRSHIFYPDVDRYFIDVFSNPFNHKKGFQTYESKTARIKMILLRLENLNSLDKEVGNFLGIDDFKFINKNTHSTKWYKELYRRFKEEYRPSQNELENIYNSKFMRYFYSTQEIKQFVKNWT